MSERRVDLQNLSNTEDITTNLLYLMYIHDSAFPIGNYTHSYGMETYIQEDIIHSKSTLIEYCQSYIETTLLYNDCLFLKEALRYSRMEDWQNLILLEKKYHASKLAVESREASKMTGKQFLQGIVQVNECGALHHWFRLQKAGEVKGHFIFAYAIYSVNQQFPENVAMLAYTYSSIYALVQNAIRAIPLGQQAGIAVMHELIPYLYATNKAVSNLTLADVSNHGVGIELSSMKHKFLPSRLFIS